MPSRMLVLVALCVSLGACKKGDGAARDEKKLMGKLAAEAAEASKLVPEALKAEVRFEARKFENEKVLAVVPVGWKGSKHFAGRLEAPKERGYKFLTGFAVGKGCDGWCQPKDWEKTVQKSIDNSLSKSAKMVKDEKLGPSSRLVVKQGSDYVAVLIYHWKKGADHYFYCHAFLGPKLQPAAAAFERACRALVPRW